MREAACRDLPLAEEHVPASPGSSREPWLHCSEDRGHGTSNHIESFWLEDAFKIMKSNR